MQRHIVGLTKGLLFGLLWMVPNGCDDADGTASAKPDAGAAEGKSEAVLGAHASNATKAPQQPKKAPHFATSNTVQTTVSGRGDGPYHFTAQWHINVAENWAKKLAEFKGKPNLRYLEIGVFEGRSVAWMLENILTDPSSTITVIDVFMGDYENTFDANMKAAGVGERLTKIKGPSQKALRPLFGQTFDVIYIDGSHTADDVLADAVLSWDLLKEDGVLIFDDYKWTGRPDGTMLPTELRPHLAIDAFVTAYRNYLEVLHSDYQLMVRRRPNPCDPKDYCSPVGQYNYFWRDLELRNRVDGSLVALTADERKLIEVIARSKQIGQVGFSFDPRFRGSKPFQALSAKLGLEL